MWTPWIHFSSISLLQRCTKRRPFLSLTPTVLYREAAHEDSAPDQSDGLRALSHKTAMICYPKL